MRSNDRKNKHRCQSSLLRSRYLSTAGSRKQSQQSAVRTPTSTAFPCSLQQSQEICNFENERQQVLSLHSTLLSQMVSGKNVCQLKGFSKTISQECLQTKKDLPQPKHYQRKSQLLREEISNLQQAIQKISRALEQVGANKHLLHPTCVQTETLNYEKYKTELASLEQENMYLSEAINRENERMKETTRQMQKQQQSLIIQIEEKRNLRFPGVIIKRIRRQFR